MEIPPRPRPSSLVKVVWILTRANTLELSLNTHAGVRFQEARKIQEHFIVYKQALLKKS